METEEIYESIENKISSLAIVHPNSIIGVGNTICEGVIIREGVQIGDNNYFGPYCIIGDTPEKIGYFETFGKVIIGSNNRFTKQVTIDSGTNDVTIVKSNVTMLKNAHVGHDAKIENGVILSCNVCIGGHTVVKLNSNFGLGAVAYQRLIIPSNCMIGMNSTVTKKTVLQSGRKYAGSPARDIGSNICVE